MKRFKRLALLLIVFAATAVHAQTTEGPLVMLMNSADLYQSFPPGRYPVRMTASGFNDRPFMSSDGIHIAYEFIDPIGVKALRQGGSLTTALPGDIDVRSLGSAGVLHAAAQPEGATFDSNQPSPIIVRSAPAWSPDGTRLAWSEEVVATQTRRLMLYDLASNTSLAIVNDLPEQNALQQTLPVRWGSEGLALLSTTIDPANVATNGKRATVLIYTDHGVKRSSAVAQPKPGEYVYDFEWIDDGGSAKVGLIYNTGRWDEVEPVTGIVHPLGGVPELYSVSNPNGLTLDFGSANLPNQGPVFTWTVVIPGAPSIPLTYTGPFETMTISPVGDSLAYADDGIGYIWHDSVETEIPGTNPVTLDPSAMIWGPTAWRVAAG